MMSEMSLLPFKRGHKPGAWLVCRAFIVERAQEKVSGLHTTRGPYLARSMKVGDTVLDILDLEVDIPSDEDACRSERVRLVSAVALSDCVRVTIGSRVRAAALGDDSYEPGVDDAMLAGILHDLLTGEGQWSVAQVNWERGAEGCDERDAFGTIAEHAIEEDTREVLRARLERVRKADDAARAILG